jgi:putative nucleotidyltransferase with HDIG domain
MMQKMPLEIRKKILNKIQDTQTLPILPDIAIETMSFVDEDDYSICQISELISKDPSLSAGILRVANSAFYGLKKNVGTLDMALVLLGLREIKNIIMMMSVFKLFPNDGKFAFDKSDYLRHSILTAKIAQLLSELMEFSFSCSPFIGGLLHDIGKLFLDQIVHDEFIKVLVEVKNKNIFMFEAEKNILGIDHAEIAGILSRSWNFPEDLTDCIEHHHQVEESKNNISLTSIIHISNLFTNARKIGLPESSKGIDILNNTGWKHLEEERPLLKNMDIEKFIFKIDDEMNAAQEILNLYSSKFSY